MEKTDLSNLPVYPKDVNELREVLKVDSLPGDRFIQDVLLGWARELLAEFGRNYFETEEGQRVRNLTLAQLDMML